MSYNGIGLKSAKGSSTSGYIQRNLGELRVGKQQETAGKKYYQRQLVEKKKEKIKKQIKNSDVSIEKELVTHERKKTLEIQVMQYRDRLEDDHPELSDGEIDERVTKYREGLLSSSYTKTINPFTRNKKQKQKQKTADLNNNMKEATQ